MLEKLFGNVVIEKVLFFILENQKSYASEIKEALSIPLYSVQIALSRLEEGGILVRQPMGKTQVYQFNPRYPFLNELQAFLKKALSALPEAMRIKLYESPVRKRPRRKGKPL
ncbi:MAG TPA: winged helix-turn-helix domain-containing protein [Rhabdochlamydiaceae bacterium]